MSSATQDGSGDPELMGILERSDDPVVTAPEVADELGVTQQAAHMRLSKAHDRGDITRKSVGARAVVWWIPR